MSKLSDSFNRMPRAMRWLSFFGAFLVLYFGVLEPSLVAANAARDRADRLEIALRRERALLATNSQAGRELERAVKTYGLPYHPTDPALRAEALQRGVNAVLMKHRVEDASYNERSGTISADAATAVVGATSKLDRFVLDVTFEATPEDAIAILADLEQTPEVTAVSRIKMDKALAGRSRDSGGTVRVTITIESWIAARVASTSTASAGWESR